MSQYKLLLGFTSRSDKSVKISRQDVIKENSAVWWDGQERICSHKDDKLCFSKCAIKQETV